MKTIKWDGRERTADAILDLLPPNMASYWGGAPGIPRELFVHASGAPIEKARKVPKGARVGLRAGKPIIIRSEIRS